jgi:hypothetical protein
MVYFGERRFRSAARGEKPRERVRIVAPMILLAVLLALLVSRQWPGSEERAAIPVRAISPTATPDATATPGGSGGDGLGLIPAPREVSLLEPNLPAEPFDPDPAPLLAVRDAGIPEPGERERAGLIWLFHRFRAGSPVPIVEPTVAWKDLPGREDQVRGERRRFTVKLVEEPIPRTLPPNPSGVLRYWEAFGRDAEGHFVRLQFIDKPKILPADTEVEVVADFLRLHRYQMIRGGEGVVPEWVAAGVSILTSPPPARSDWGPVLLVGALALAALAPIVWGILRGEGRSRRRFAIGRTRRGGEAPAPPSTRG